MLTEQLEGSMLDYWAAKAIGLTPKIANCDGDTYCATMQDSAGIGSVVSEERWREPHIGYPFSPSTDWADGGPIIDAHRIGIVPDGDKWTALYYGNSSVSQASASGHTPLIAAMRALVASKFGEEVSDE